MRSSAFTTIVALIFIAAVAYIFLFKPQTAQQPRNIIRYSNDVLQIEFKTPSKIWELTDSVFLQISMKNEGPKTVNNIELYTDSFPFYIQSITTSHGECSRKSKLLGKETPNSFTCSIESLESKDIADIIVIFSAPEIEEQTPYEDYEIPVVVGYDYEVKKVFTIPLLNKNLAQYTSSKPSFSEDEYSPIGIDIEFDIRNSYQTPTRLVRGEWLYPNQPFVFNIDFFAKGKIRPSEVIVKNTRDSLFYVEISPQSLVVTDRSYCRLLNLEAVQSISGNSVIFDFFGENFTLVKDSGNDLDIRHRLGEEITIHAPKEPQVGFVSEGISESIVCEINFYEPEMPEVHPTVSVYLPFTYKFIASTRLRVYNIA